jgi:two-component system OmpR family response regulator
VLETAAGTAPRALLVEADTSTRDALFVALTLAGFEIRGLVSGSEFDAVFAEFRPDIVALEVLLPDGPDGFQLAERILTEGNTPVVFVTAATTLAHRLRAFEIGADDYILKPFEVEEVVARMRAVLRRTGRVAAPTIHVGDLSVDQLNQVAYRGGTRLELTVTEFQLLAALARSPWKVWSKRELLSAVWGPGAYRENLVEAYVSTLRRKLEHHHGHRMIFTERSRGYTLRP